MTVPPDYALHVDACLKRVERWVMRLDDDDLDYTPGDGLLVLEFEDGTRFVLNRQAAAGQMWLAAGARAWHYNWDDQRQTWVDDRDGHELYGHLAAVVGDKLGRQVAFEE